LDIRAPDTFSLKLFRTHGAIQQRDRAQVLEVVVGLLLGPRSALIAVGSPTGEVIRALKDLKADPLDVGTAKIVGAADGQDGVDDGLPWINEQYCFR